MTNDDDPLEFTYEELHAACRDVGATARREAFAHGLTVMVARKDRLILVYPDGHEEDAGAVRPVLRNEIPGVRK
jgi:hypothetical protein